MPIQYKSKLKSFSRHLRIKMTTAERILWGEIRRKQISNIQFQRQKPIGPFIVDFVAPAVKLIIEIDGSQHQDPGFYEYDLNRDAYLNRLGFYVMRFENCEIEGCLDLVLIEVERYIAAFLAK